MANFFGKPKAGPSTAPIASSALTLPRRDTYEDMPRKVVEDEFSKTFRPFVVKKDAELAPVNWFLERRTAKGKGKGKEVIVLDGDDTGDVVLAQGDEGSMKEEEMTDVMPVQQSLEFVPDRGESPHILKSLPIYVSPERLQGLLKSMPPLVGGSRPRVSNDSIRSILGLLSDAEVNGDTALVRTCLDRLSDRTAFPAKVLVFPGDSRPGYLGTHTKVSSVIRPRAPFNQDTVALDYSCDSGEEWEGEEEGAGDDVADDDEDGPDAGDDDDDSDADSWLVDDDSVDNVTLPDLDRASPFSDISLGGMSIDMRAVSPTLSLKKRKGAQVEEKPKGDKKRKVVVPLIPYTKGPYWETEVGVCEYAPFEEYRIRLFNGEPSIGSSPGRQAHYLQILLSGSTRSLSSRLRRRT
jgi:chromatin assembly factor 1 subunit A